MNCCCCSGSHTDGSGGVRVPPVPMFLPIGESKGLEVLAVDEVAVRPEGFRVCEDWVAGGVGEGEGDTPRGGVGILLLSSPRKLRAFGAPAPAKLGNGGSIQVQ